MKASRISFLLFFLPPIKTTLCIVYKDGEYPQEPYVPTIFENYAGGRDERFESKSTTLFSSNSDIKQSKIHLEPIRQCWTGMQKLISRLCAFSFCLVFKEEYDQLRIMAYPNTNVFILCFSVVDPDSYSNILSKWIPELNRMFSNLKTRPGFSSTSF